MAATTFLALKDKNDSLVMTASDWYVGLRPWVSGAPNMPTDLCDSSGVLQSLPAGWKTSGEIQKAAGVSLAPDMQTASIEGYGSGAPRRMITTGESFTIDYFAQEWRKVNQEIWHNVDMSATSAAAGKGYRARKTGELTTRFYSALLIAKDFGSDYLYPFFMFPKVSVSKKAAMSGEIGKELGLPCTLTAYVDSVFGGMYDFGVAGAGFDSIAVSADFASAATSINLLPPTLTLAAGESAQLLVIDNNGFDRTSAATFVSGTPAKAAVTAGGRITAVATGSSTITATVGALTDTTAVTVS